MKLMCVFVLHGGMVFWMGDWWCGLMRVVVWVCGVVG